MNAKKATTKDKKQERQKPVKPRLQEKYESEIQSTLREKLGRDNVMAIPRLEKVVINMGVGKATQDKKILEDATDALTMIAGQKPVVT